MKKNRLLVFFILILIPTNIYLMAKLKLAYRQPIIPQTTENVSPKTTIALVGDISLNREVNYQISVNHNPNLPFENIACLTKNADITAGNLEGPLIANCPVTRTGMKFCGNLENVNGLTFAGFDLLNLSNNHIENYGREGIDQTIQALTDQSIDYFGLGKIGHKTIGKTKFAFVGFDDTVRPLTEKEVIDQITEAKQQADFTVVSFHWGEEYQKIPNQRQKDLAYLAIDNGADLIFGHHPHVTQTVEYYKEKPIIFSLGNFVFDQNWSRETGLGQIALITITDREIIDIKYIPVEIRDNFRPEPVEK